MELRHLRYFVVVAEELHFARAAERLNIAPSTLTVQIQEIERVIDATLLERTKRSVKLTTAGELFLEQARASLAQVALALDVGRRAGRGEVGRVEIGYVGSAALAGVLQEQIFRFRAVWPDVQLRAKEVAMMTLPSLIVEGKVDVGLIRLPMALPDELCVHVLGGQPFCLALPVQHRLANTTHPVSPVELRSDRFVMPEQSLGTREVGHRGSFEPTVCSAPGNLLAVLTEVSMGIGISIVPDVVRGTLALPGVIFKKLEGKPIISEIAAVYRSNESAPAINNLIQQFVDQRRQNA